MSLKLLLTALSLIFLVGCQQKNEDNQTKQTDTNTPLHLLQPDYPLAYGQLKKNDIYNALSRVHQYLDEVTPYQLINSESGEVISDTENPGNAAKLAAGEFRITSYEWGVTYAGMLSASDVTGDPKFQNYTFNRLNFISELYPYYKKEVTESAHSEFPIQSVVNPKALDDAGALCAAMIKAQRAGSTADLMPLIENFIDFIMNRQYRLEDGTLARNRPLKNTLWIDDLFMSVPALAQMGVLTGEKQYFDEAVNQVLLFSDKMFNHQKGLYMHGRVMGTDDYPQFHWGRANGWAFMTLVELLDALPTDHPHRDQVMQYFMEHAKGLAACQSGQGLWHQLLDKNDSYLETSATAIYTYGFAKAINKGWLDYKVFGPLTLLGWQAVAERVNENGQIEGTCVGTGMGFDPMFYYYRPTSVYAAHGYGPVILAGAEVIRLLDNYAFDIDETAVQFKID